MYQRREKLNSATEDFIKQRILRLEADTSPQRHCFFTVFAQSPLLSTTAVFLQGTKWTLLCPALCHQDSCWNTPLLPPCIHTQVSYRKNRAAGGKREMLLPRRYLGCGQGTCLSPSEI